MASTTIGPKSSRELLIRAEAMLEMLDYCRTVTGVPHLGEQVSKQLVDAILKHTEVQTGLQEADEEFTKVVKKEGE